MALKLSRQLKKLLLGYASSGVCLKTAMTNFTINILDGAQPDNPEAATTANVLLTITGCDFNNAAYDATAANVVMKKETGAWTGTGSITGTATWFRCFNPTGGDTGINEDTGFTFSRIDGAISQTSGELVMDSTTITVSVAKTIDQFNIAIT